MRTFRRIFHQPFKIKISTVDNAKVPISFDIVFTFYNWDLDTTTEGITRFYGVPELPFPVLIIFRLLPLLAEEVLILFPFQFNTKRRQASFSKHEKFSSRDYWVTIGNERFIIGSSFISNHFGIYFHILGCSKCPSHI